LILSSPIAPPITRLGAQQAARDELSKGIYHRNSEPLVVRAVRAAGHFLDDLLNRAFAHAPGGGLGALVIVVVVVGLIAVVVWRVGLPRSSAHPQSQLLPAGTVMSAAGHRLAAFRAAETSDWHTAVIERMRAVARELEENGTLDPQPGRTASELSAQASARLPAAAHEMRAAAATFNRVMYGDGDATSDDHAAVAAADDAVRTAARSRVLVS
jgi:hypothetical protein